MTTDWTCVTIESPYAGDVEDNLAYCRRAMAHALSVGEAPYASHALYTQKDVLDDTIAEQRRRGIDAGFAWSRRADARVIYIDLGISSGMIEGIEDALSIRQPCVLRWFDHRPPGLSDVIDELGVDLAYSNCRDVTQFVMVQTHGQDD